MGLFFQRVVVNVRFLTGAVAMLACRVGCRRSTLKQTALLAALVVGVFVVEFFAWAEDGAAEADEV